MESFFLAPIYDLVITELYVRIKRQIRHCFCAGSDILELDRLLGELQLTKEIIKEKIQEFELEQKLPNQEVKNWLLKAEGAELDAIALKNEHEKQKMHMCGCSCNFMANLKTGQSLTKKMAALNELTNNAPTEVATTLPPPVREVPIPWHVVGQQNYLNEAINYLGHNTDNIIGIHGMGGVGKTTLLESINNYHKSADQIQFHDVVFVFIGKNHNVFMIQKDISHAVHLNITRCKL